jgi:ABC-type amino acid transport substrate-binding protein
VHTVLYRVMHEPPRLGPENERLSGELRALVSRCLAKQASRRPGLAEILPLATEHAGTEFWLPPALTARLGRDAADLLGVEGPEADRPPPSWGPPAVRHDQTTYASAELAPPKPPEPVPTRRRGRYVLAAVSGAVVLAVTVGMIVANGIGGADSQEAPLADRVPQDVLDAGGITVHIATTSDPVNFVAEGEGSPAGFEVDLAEAIGEQLGVDIRFAPTGESSTAAEAAVREGEDVAAHIAMAGFPDNSADRDELGVDFVNHFVDGWAVMSGDPENSGVVAELCGMALATWEGELMADVVRRNTENCSDPVEITPFRARDDMAAAIRAGDVDAAVLVYSQAAYYVGEHPDSGLSVSFDPQERGTRGIAVHPEQEELRDALLAAIGALLDDGTYGELLEQWHIPRAAISRPNVNAGG